MLIMRMLAQRHSHVPAFGEDKRCESQAAVLDRSLLGVRYTQPYVFHFHSLHSRAIV